MQEDGKSKVIIRIMKTGKSYEIVVKKGKKKTSGAGAEGDRRTDGEQRKCLAGNSG